MIVMWQGTNLDLESLPQNHKITLEGGGGFSTAKNYTKWYKHKFLSVKLIEWRKF